jgi:hypothetical protein
MFLLMPWLLRHGLGFWPTVAIGCALTILLYFAMAAAAPKLGLRL